MMKVNNSGEIIMILNGSNNMMTTVLIVRDTVQITTMWQVQWNLFAVRTCRPKMQPKF